MSEKTSYRSIIKSATIFGGVQVANIAISLIRNKAIALLIGPAGIGMVGLFTSAINFISGLTSLGLETSAVKFISQHNADDEKDKLHTIVAVLRKLVWITGLCGALVIACLSHYLSMLTFGNSTHTLSFVLLSLAVLFRQVSIGELALLQGLQKLRWLAQANLTGNVLGLLISLPLYFFFKIDAILPSIIISSFTGFCLSWHYSRKTSLHRVKVTSVQLLQESKEMLRLGGVISVISLTAAFVAYVIQIYITKIDGLTAVGNYHAGFTLLNSYAALVLTAMATDYLPRLLAVSNDNSKLHKVIQEQMQFAVLLMIPIIALFIVFAPLIIKILFSAKFIVILPMLRIGIIGMLFRAASWPMSYIFIAKGNLKQFILVEVSYSALFLLLHIICYNRYGLTGLGIAYFIQYVLYFAGLLVVIYRKYRFMVSIEFVRVLAA
ncbi:MAG TPA: O-antigen translocase, partial [Flavobacterium sp.]